uniref:Uncharacterized protein n=1 Tax=Oryza nivara TaxID=4536 RepID=A0A0E0FJ06_ORYNI
MEKCVLLLLVLRKDCKEKHPNVKQAIVESSSCIDSSNITALVASGSGANSSRKDADDFTWTVWSAFSATMQRWWLWLRRRWGRRTPQSFA